MTVDLEIRRKRMIYRANYRGFKEADLLLGGFAKKHGPDFSAQQVTEYETLLEENDHNIYAWIMGTEAVPAQYDTPLFHRIKAFDPLEG